jgi:hypothetical protein
MIGQSVSGLALGSCVIMMLYYDTLERDLGTNEDVFPAKPASNFADRALDVTRCRTIFTSRSLQSRWIVPHDRNALTKKG